MTSKKIVFPNRVRKILSTHIKPSKLFNCDRLFVVLLIILIMFVHHSLISKSLPFTHDSQNHLARIANYYLALKQGQFPPRLAPSLNNGFGYPVFNFNYPLPQILALPLVIVNIPIQTTFTILTFFSLIVSGLGIYQLVRSSYSPLPALAAAFFYLFNPYQLSLIYIRGVIGESLSLALLPWLLFYLKKSIRSPSPSYFLMTSFIGALFILSHNIIVMFSLPLLLIFALYQSRLNLRLLVKPIFLGIISLLLTAFFWLPAITEKSSTTLDSVPLQKDYAAHFPTCSQLITSPFDWGFSYSGPVDGLGFHLGTIQIFILIIGIIYLFLSLLSSRSIDPALIIILTAILLLTFLMLPISSQAWQLIPIAAYIQFPWRLLFFTQLLFSFLAAYLAQKIYHPRILLPILILLPFTSIHLAHNPVFFHHPDEYWFSFPQTTSVLDENMPKYFQKNSAYELDQTLFASQSAALLNHQGQVTINSWTTTYREYQVHTNHPDQIIERSIYFPGFITYLDGKRITYSDPQKYHGLISFPVNPGHHRIITQFTQNTMPRQIGNSLSILGLIILIIHYYYETKHRL